MEKFQTITVMLHEYDTLRTETLYRYSAQFQTTTVFAAVVVGLVTLAVTRGFSRPIVALLIFALVVYFGMQIWIFHDVCRVHRQLDTIEERVNNLAGEKLLTWETEHGLGGLTCICRE
jgi:lysylphosphatidylglycerol synthetase-like protein (DUF2156 family)